MISYVEPGEMRPVVLPYSEVCMYMRVAGRRMNTQLLAEPGRKPAVQLIDDSGRRFSFPITPGEAGFQEDENGFYLDT